MTSTVSGSELPWGVHFDAIQDGICLLDLDYTITRANPRAEEWFGAGRPLVGEKCFAVFRGRATPCALCPARPGLHAGQHSQGLILSPGDQGKGHRWLEFYLAPLVDAALNEVVGLTVYFRDLSPGPKPEEAGAAPADRGAPFSAHSRRQPFPGFFLQDLPADGSFMASTPPQPAGRAWQDSESRYRLLAEHISDVLWTVDLDLRLTYVTPSLKQLLGVSPETVLGKSIGEFLLPSSLGLALEVFSDEMAREHRAGPNLDPDRSRTFELAMRHRQGDLIWTEVKARFLRDAAGHPVGILGVTRDITPRKRAAEDQRRQQEVLEAVNCAAQKLLRGPGWEMDLQEILAHLGKTLKVSRTYLFENNPEPSGALMATVRYSWRDPEAAPPGDLPPPQLPFLQEDGLARWRSLLSQGQMVAGSVQDFPPVEQDWLAAQGLQSLVLAPIFVGQKWWGGIGIDECRQPRRWSSLEREALATAAGILGAAILRHQSERELKDSEEKLRSLSSHILEAQEKERHRLATELHNVLGHDLLLLKLRLESLESQLHPDQGPVAQEIREIARFIRQSVGNVRRLYLDLTPGDLEDLGLTTALYIMLEEFAGANKIKWLAKIDNLEGLFDLTHQKAIYRLVQEALTNIGKHAQARRVSLRAKKTAHRVTFRIEDDGQGFEPATQSAPTRTMGLLSMEERVKTLGGTIRIQSQKGKGTTISFSLPLFPEGDGP